MLTIHVAKFASLTVILLLYAKLNSYDRTDSSAHLAEAFQSSCSSTTGSSASDWYLDTGAPAHMTPDATSLDSSEQHDGKDTVIVGNGASLPITRIGSSQTFPHLPLLDLVVVPRLT